ncbi:MAG: hypothetical protein J7496_05465 [Novosphingobium sp.]|nr:hypothetical protein [Novosphingobium sp.]
MIERGAVPHVRTVPGARFDKRLGIERNDQDSGRQIEAQGRTATILSIL